MYSFKYKKIRYINFLSTGNQYTEIDLIKSPMTLIYGRNGSGKSTILDAFCFCLYGRPFRRVKKEKLINSVNGAGARVEIEGESYGREYKIVRGLKPNIFEIWQDGVLLNQSAAVKDQQEYLTRNILHMDMKACAQLVTLGSASYVQFMQLKPDVRREVIEDLLDIKVFSGMASALKTKISDNRERFISNDKDIVRLREVISLHEKNALILREDLDIKLAGLDTTIAEYTTAIAVLKLGIEDIDKQVDSIRVEMDKKYPSIGKKNELGKLKAALEVKLKHAIDHRDFFQSEDNCPTCSQSILDDVKDDKTTEYSMLIDKHKETMYKLDAAIISCDADIAEYESLALTNSKLLRERVQLLEKQSMYTTRIKDMQQEISMLELRGSSVLISDEDLNKLREELATCEEKAKSISDEKELFEIASVILRDSGIKAKIVKQYIPIINALVNKYLAAMDFFVKFELNENFEEKIYSRHRDEFEYDSFSEGEKCRINIALLLAWRNIAKMKNSVNSNLLIMDEIFDGAADFTGMDSIMELLSNLGEDVNVFIISPKGDAMVDKFKATIQMEKHGNFSRIAA
jgi:DNA repair exonuclease SbcCD ATPase subunit